MARIDLDTYDNEIICAKELKIINCTQDNIYKLYLLNFEPGLSDVELALSGKLADIDIPTNPIITHIECISMEIETITVPDTLKNLFCGENKIKHLSLPSTLEMLIADDNCIEEIIFRDGDPLELMTFVVDNNQLKTFDYKLNVFKLNQFYIQGNPDLKIKHFDFLFIDFYYNTHLRQDVDEVYFKRQLWYTEYLQARLHCLIRHGHTYITYDDLVANFPEKYLHE